MKLFLAKAILKSFGIGVVLSLILIFAIKIATAKPHSPDEPYRNMNCFTGQEYAIPVGINLFLALTSLLAYLNIFQIIRQNLFISLASFFLIHLVLFYLSIREMISESDVWILICYFSFYMLPWAFYYIKFKKLYIQN